MGNTVSTRIFLKDFHLFSFLVFSVYYDVLNGKARDAEANNTIEVLMNFTSAFATSRFWEIRVSQIPFSQRAPAGCLQYFTGNEGIIQVKEKKMNL